MKKPLLLCLSLIITSCIFAQNLTLDKLLEFQNQSLNSIEDELRLGGWELHKTSIDNTDYFGDLYTNYNAITWSYNKNRWNNKAEAWFYLYQYQNFDNALTYQIGKEAFTKLKSEIQYSSTFKLIKTEAVNEGLETRYRGNKLEIILKQYYKNQSSDVPVAYFITIFNYKEMEQQIKLAEERQEREYQEQLRLEKERQIRDSKFQKFITEAQNLERLKKYSEALKTYKSALDVKPEEKEVQYKIIQIANLIQFLNDRNNKIYNYKEAFYLDYESINARISASITEILFDEKTINPETIKITANVDTLGVTHIQFSSTVSEPKLKEKFKQISKTIQLDSAHINGFTVFAQAIFEYKIMANETTIRVNKNAKGLDSKDSNFNTYRSYINNALYSAPMGEFTLQFNNATINGKENIKYKVLKYNCNGGPSNALLSLIIPGLGDHRVSYGKNKGLGVAISTYGLIGAGIGLKLYSNSEYRKYLESTEQNTMDQHYKRANYSNQAFYTCVIAGGIIWISDIIWVATTGTKNAKAGKLYKQSHLGIYYDPNTLATGLSYTINF